MIRHPYGYAAIAVVVVWIAVAACSIFAPDMISGAENDHLPLAALTAWFPGSVASGLVLAAVSRRGGDDPAPWAALALVVGGLWIAVALVSVMSPSLVTGTDPTTIPIAALLAPMAGLIGTAFAAVFAASSARSSQH